MFTARLRDGRLSLFLAFLVFASVVAISFDSHDSERARSACPVCKVSAHFASSIAVQSQSLTCFEAVTTVEFPQHRFSLPSVASAPANNKAPPA